MRIINTQDCSISIEKALKDPSAWIPKGMFCISFAGFDSKEGVGLYARCPFWELRADKPEFENGYCHYLGRGDWEVEGLSLLYDECKECGVSYDVEYSLMEDDLLKKLKEKWAEEMAEKLVEPADAAEEAACAEIEVEAACAEVEK